MFIPKSEPKTPLLQMNRPKVTLRAMFASYFSHRELIRQMSTREVLGRYRGSFGGLAWSFFNPLVMLAVYSFVFGFVFKTRWGSETGDHTDFTLALFLGMIVHGLLAESVNRSPSLVVGNTSYVKKVVFPLEILAWVSFESTLFHSAVSLVVWSLVYLLVMQEFHATALLLPLVWAPLVFFNIGFSWFLSSLGVYLRDIGQVTGIATTAMLFLSPVFYSLEKIPEEYRSYFYLNPISLVIEQSRAVLMHGEFPDWIGLTALFLAGLGVAWSGFAWFQYTRRGFADVL